MPAPLYAIEVSAFGGVNYADEPSGLLLRSHQINKRTFVHRAGFRGAVPMEAAQGQNFDFVRNNLVKRDGSTSYADLTSGGANVWLASDVGVLFAEVRLPATGALAQFVVSKKTIYTNQSGSWTQINNSGGTAYTHSDQTVTAATILVLDGGVFFGLDGTNKIQRYISGTDLEEEMDNGNGYTDAGGTGQTITGTWGTGYDRLASLAGRLIFNDGTSTVQYTATNEPYDLTGGGNFPASGAVRSLNTHVPQFGDSLTEILYIGTGSGFEFTSSLASASTIEGSPVALNNASVFSTRNWLVAMDAQGRLWGINGNRVIDLGRRFRALDGSSGPLDQINLSNSTAVAHGSYNAQKQQAAWWFSTAASGNPDMAVTLDFELGEPVLDEPLESYEQHIRCLPWAGQDYVSAQTTQDGYIGLRSGGTLWTLNNGTDDYGSTAVDANWYGPMFDGGAATASKKWRVNQVRFLTQGDWDVQEDYLLDRDVSSTRSWQINQGADASVYGTATYGSGTYSGTGIVKGTDDTDLYSEILQIKLTSSASGETFRLTNLRQTYQLGTEER